MKACKFCIYGGTCNATNCPAEDMFKFREVDVPILLSEYRDWSRVNVFYTGTIKTEQDFDSANLVIMFKKSDHDIVLRIPVEAVEDFFNGDET